ncbi:MAG: bifunctional DNA-formamidopyrimidine glycosylase/DNA-(apurinic or apyrimidinic site) lyase [Candidatus Lambdaproteobacteria bacterium]|nr:bifunctional DNA-formamidopyrimidine glycosylase/DNA-(apurinic or apyrimidinic site) lyase [Candidatus Lambdaproteobacteria bacterium]
MPELPEVETIVRELNAAVTGRRIERVRVLRADALGEVPPGVFAQRLAGRAIAGIERRGKYLIFRLEPRRFLVAHLRMTGKFALSPALASPAPHHRVWFGLDDGALLVFQDARCFGTLRVVDSLADAVQLEGLGVEPLSRDFTAAWLARALGQSRAPLKSWLLHQGHIAGLGNIYAAEILFAARLSPRRPANSLNAHEVQRLLRATRRVLRLAIRKNGTTISDFARVDSKRGEFQHLLKVYGRADEACAVCRTPIARIVQAQRSTFYCPQCQC